jgi:hypothetical protein
MRFEMFMRMRNENEIEIARILFNELQYSIFQYCRLQIALAPCTMPIKVPRGDKWQAKTKTRPHSNCSSNSRHKHPAVSRKCKSAIFMVHGQRPFDRYVWKIKSMSNLMGDHPSVDDTVVSDTNL